jgi:hypothetical protein
MTEKDLLEIIAGLLTMGVALLIFDFLRKYFKNL